MPKGKPWSREEEKHLLQLRNEGCRVSEIALAMGKSEQAVMKKLQRLGLKVVQQRESNGTTSTSELVLPEELYTVEEALGLLAGAMKVLQTPGLSKTEVMRLRSLIQAASVYQVKFAEYLDYRGIEKKLIELERKYAELVKREPVREEKPVEGKQELVGEQVSIEAKQGDQLVEVKLEDDGVVEEAGNPD